MITFVNPGFESITGYSHDEALGSTVQIIRSGAHDEAFYRELWEGVRAGRVWAGRIVNRRKDGTLHHEEKTIAPIQDQSGRFAGSVEIGRDVTEQLEWKPLDLNEVVANLLKMIQRVIGEHIRLSFLPGTGLGSVTGDAAQLDQVLLDLCLNARDAMPGGGTLTIETDSATLDGESLEIHPWAKPGRYVQLSIADSGSGMDAETLSHLFEPFFTTKEAGKGTGLGLATAYGIIKHHQGMIHPYREQGKGSTFRIYLPARETAVSGAPVEPDEEPAPGGTETILLAEDEEAALLFAAHESEIALALMDVVMPALGGREAADRMRSRRPDLPVLFAGGYSAESPIARLTLEVRDTALIQKPYNLKDMLRRVRGMIDAGRRPDAPARS